MKEQQNSRPVNLNLFTIKFPIPAIVSILHRISGVILFLLIPGMLWVLNQSLLSDENFNHLSSILGQLWVRCLVWLVLSAMMYHLLAGLRHILLDMGIAETPRAGRFTAAFVLVLSIILAVCLGVRLLW